MTTLSGRFEDVGNFLGRRRAHDALLFGRGRVRLDLAEGAEQDVGECAVHRLAHDDLTEPCREAPSRAPAMISTLLLSTKPIRAAAKPA